jgi:hypothetical protein
MLPLEINHVKITGFFFFFLCTGKKGIICTFPELFSAWLLAWEEKSEGNANSCYLNAITSTNSVSTCKINKNSADMIGKAWSCNVNLLCWCKLLNIIVNKRSTRFLHQFPPWLLLQLQSKSLLTETLYNNRDLKKILRLVFHSGFS